MSEQKKLISEQLINLIPCLMCGIPIVWLLQTEGVLGIFGEYFMFYYCAMLFIALLMTAIDKEKMLYYAGAAYTVAVLIVFRDRELALNCLAAFIVFSILMMLIRSRGRREVLTLIAIVLTVICLWRAEPTKAVAASLTGLIILAISGYITKHGRYAVTLVVLIECIVLLVNVDTSPLLWKPLTKGVDKVMLAVSDAFKNTEYRLGAFDSVSYTGYNEPGGMFKGVNYRYREELDVQITGKISRIYLKGASYAGITSNGVAERISEEIDDNGWFAIYLNSLYKYGITKEQAASFSKLLKVNVKYEYMKTEDVMRSANLLSIDEDKEGDEHSRDHEYSFNYAALDYANPYLDYVVKNGGFVNGPRNNKGFGTAMAYDYFYRMNMTGGSNLMTDEGLEGETSVKPAAYSVIKDYAYDIYNIKLEDIIDEAAYEQAFIQYEKDAEDERYLDTALVTDRIRELTKEVTKDAATDYEKARKIESFLRQYSYDHKMDLRGRDNYIEAFLFETQSGYCVHFASAMVVMLRSIGIPARYTQGYRHVTKKGEAVYSNEAHAWPEAFIKGTGWVPFEPTVIYLSAKEAGWGLMPKEKKEEVKEKVSGYDPATAVPPSDVETQKKKAGVSDDMGDENPDALSLKDTVIGVIKKAGGYLSGLMGMAVLLVIIYRLVEIISYKRLSPYDKVLSDIGVISRKCDKRLDGDTKVLSVFDYIPYIKQKKTEYDLNEVFREYYRIRYRGDEPDGEFVVRLHKLAKNA
ncbi:MAG: transglutaminase domain-containing protein [Lachnospiraceae bacterium]|nr:transglutaminase domain-containing protein [Lachnospiraceae bacterium]